MNKMKKLNRWEKVKQRGQDHYKTSGCVEPIDLLKDGEMLGNFALGNIIKYAYRNRNLSIVDIADMEKIKHYADILIAAQEMEEAQDE